MRKTQAVSETATPVVKAPLIHEVRDRFFGLSYNKRRAQPGLKHRPDHLDYEILDPESSLVIGAVRIDKHSDCVRVLGVRVCPSGGTPQWRKIPTTKFTCELDAVQAIRMAISIFEQQSAGAENGKQDDAVCHS